MERVSEWSQEGEGGLAATHEAISWLVKWFSGRCKRDKNSIKTTSMNYADEICKGRGRFVREKREKNKLYSYIKHIFNNSNRLILFIDSGVCLLQNRTWHWVYKNSFPLL